VSTVSAVSEIARNYLRDFPRFFQVSFDTVGRTFELGYTNIDRSSIWAASYATNASAPTSLVEGEDFSLDSRNGILRLSSALPVDTALLVEGYHFQWVSPEDLDFYSKIAINLHMHNSDMDMDNLLPAVEDIIGIYAVVETLWGLTTEFSRDIDVMTSESIHIPASQRFRMVQSMLQYWITEYENKAKALNIGLHRIEIFNLRRVSRTTNRLVPVYRNKEVGDFAPLERLWIPVDKGEIELEDVGDDLRNDVLVDGEPPQSYVPNTTAYY
jgi:hypothetical protein